MRCDIAVVVATHRRPELLKRLLLEVSRQSFDGDFVVVVADNDADHCEGLAAVQEVKRQCQFPMISFSVETKGISYTRNALLNYVFENIQCEYIAFIDDDEWPSENWLSNMYAQAHQTSADVVAGPVVSVFDQDPDEVVKGSDQFKTKVKPDGLLSIVTSTENAFVKMSFLNGMERPWFDPYFAHTGGEDADLFKRMKSKSAVFAWDQSAFVYESVPPQRANKRWILRRNLRRGSTTVRRILYRPGKMYSVPRALFFCLGALFVSPLLFLCFIYSPLLRFNYLSKFYRGLGYLIGFLNIKIEEYK